MRVLKIKDDKIEKKSSISKFKGWLYNIDWLPVSIYDFIVEWIFPAYKLKRVFGFDRYDVVKCGVDRLNFADTPHRILHANMNLLCQFVESKQLDAAYFEDEYRFISYLPFGEQEEKNFININEVSIKDEVLEIYNWWKIERDNLEKESEYFLHFWHETFCYPLEECFEKSEDGYYVLNSKYKNPSLDEIKNSKLFKSEYIYKYLTDNDITDREKVIGVHNMLDNKIDYTDNKMLIKLMKIRQYIWEP